MNTSNNEKIANKAINMINGGASWEQVCKNLYFCKSYIQKIIKGTYKTEKDYNNLLAKAKANKKAIDEASRVIIDTESDSEEDEVKEVIVVETGYLMKKGVEGITGENLDIFIPHFCIRELEKLAKSHKIAKKVLLMFCETITITPINLMRREEILEKPAGPAKIRTYGVVAVCCYLWRKGYRVRLLTNSREIERMANEQCIEGLCVVKVI